MFWFMHTKYREIINDLPNAIYIPYNITFYGRSIGALNEHDIISVSYTIVVSRLPSKTRLSVEVK